MRAGGSGGPGEAGQGEPHTGIGELVGCEKEQRTVGAAWHSLDTPWTSCEAGFGGVFSVLRKCRSIEIQGFCGASPACRAAGGYLGEEMKLLFCIDKVFIFCLQSLITLLKCLSFVWDLFPSCCIPVNHIRHCSSLEM